MAQRPGVRSVDKRRTNETRSRALQPRQGTGGQGGAKLPPAPCPGVREDRRSLGAAQTPVDQARAPTPVVLPEHALVMLVESTGKPEGAVAAIADTSTVRDPRD